MAISLKFYSDGGLSIPFDALTIMQADDGSTPSQDFIVYLGSTAVGQKFQSAVFPGSAQIFVSLSDSSMAAGLSSSQLKLALSNAGLTSAIAGAPLSLEVTEIFSGVGNAIPVHVRFAGGVIAQGVYTDLSLAATRCIEVPV